MNNTTEPLQDVPAIAALLSVSEQHVYRMVREKQIPFVRIGRLVKFDPATIRTWLETRQVPAVKR